MARTVTRPKRGSLEDLLTQWATMKSEGDLIAKRQKELRDEMTAEVQEKGIPDEKGSLYLNLHTEVTVGSKTYRTLKSERRVSERLDETAAEQLLAGKGLLERAMKTVVVFDPNELYVLNQEGLLSDDELDSLIVISESWAFKPQVEAVAE
jgi:hypothetical protein